MEADRALPVRVLGRNRFTPGFQATQNTGTRICPDALKQNRLRDFLIVYLKIKATL